MKLTSILTRAVTLLSTASAYGINCRGSIWCAGAAEAGGLPTDRSPTNEHSAELAHYINRLPDDTFIYTDDLIGCTRTICAYLQNIPVDMGGLYARTVKRMAEDIVQHECKRCGKRALMFDEEEARTGEWGKEYVWNFGMLKFDYVPTDRRVGNEDGEGDNHCGRVLNGLCPSYCRLVDGCVIPKQPKIALE